MEPAPKVKITIYLSPDVHAALHEASFREGGYGKKSEIIERALRRELGLDEKEKA